MSGRASGFLSGERDSGGAPRRRLPGALTLSVGTHAAALIVLLLLANGRTTPMMEVGTPPPRARVAWLATLPGPAGTRGGGGDEAPAPPRAARARGEGITAVPVSPPPAIQPAERPREVPPMPVASGLLPSAAGLETLSGVLDAPVLQAESRGPGAGDGAGGRPGGGIGPEGGNRAGSGGPGPGGDGPGGFGGTVSPQVLVKVPPQYTQEAARARIQGVAVLEAVVMSDGSVGEVRIVRSLDSVFGLDRQAIRAVKAWRFVPGTRGGRPIPMLVTIELTFTLR